MKKPRPDSAEAFSFFTGPVHALSICEALNQLIRERRADPRDLVVAAARGVAAGGAGEDVVEVSRRLRAVGDVVDHRGDGAAAGGVPGAGGGIEGALARRGAF